MLFYFLQRGTPAQEAVDTCNNHPHILKSTNDTGDVSNIVWL